MTMENRVFIGCRKYEQIAPLACEVLEKQPQTSASEYLRMSSSKNVGNNGSILAQVVECSSAFDQCLDSLPCQLNYSRLNLTDRFGTRPNGWRNDVLTEF